MKFSTIVEAVGSFPKVCYHITPTENIKSILENGLVMGSRRSTNGIETQNKIYLTSKLEDIQNPFPNHFGWQLKDMSVVKVNVPIDAFRTMEQDPEYMHGMFYMVSANINPEHLDYLGRFDVEEKDVDLFSLTKKVDEKVNENKDEPLGILKGSTKVGVYSLGKVVDYAYKLKDGDIYYNGLVASQEKMYDMGIDIYKLPDDYEDREGQHFHSRDV